MGKESSAKILRGKNYDYEPDRSSLGAFFFEASDRYSDKTAQVCSVSGKTETFGSIKRRAIRVALGMRQKGIDQGDVVVLCSKNTMDSTVPMLATQFLGAKTAALDPTLSVLDTTHLLGLVEPKMVFVSEEAVELIEKSLEKHKFEVQIVVYGSTKKYLQFSDFEATKSDEERFRPVLAKNVRDTAIILFSSGTTGLPKGICISHFGIQYSAVSFLRIGINTTSMLHYSSLYWISAVTILIMSYHTGGKRVVCGQFNGDTMAKIVQDHRVTFIFMAPTYTYKLNEENTKYDTSSLKSLIIGGTPISEQQILKTRRLFPHTLLFQGYGMTEASGFIATFHSDEDRDLIERKPLSSGKPAPGLSIKIVNPDNEEILGANEKGEIRIYTKALTVGYYNKDSSGIVDSEGYLLSGDIGYYDDDRTLYVVDRIKEMFKYQSWHIVPAVLENLFMSHPAVAEVAVFGIPHDEDDNHIAAAVVIKTNYRGEIDPEDIRKFVDDQVNDRQKIRGGVYFVYNIPKTPTGKIRRRDVRDSILKMKKKAQSQ